MRIIKTILTIIGTVLLSINTFGQLKIQEASKDSVVWQASKLTSVPKLIHFYGKTDNYTMYYKNAKYSAITDIKYISIGDLETTIQFFEVLSDVIVNDKEINVEIEGEMWLLRKAKKYVSIYSTYGYFYLSQKQIDSILEELNQNKDE
jgi:hypothetical protein